MDSTTGYQLRPDFDGIVKMPEWQFIPRDPANPDWQEYQRWLQAGNEPTPAEAEAAHGTRRSRRAS